MPAPQTHPPITDQFKTRFGRVPTVIGRAPGRVNLIGEHTDYNDGFVMPMALEHATWVAAAPRDDGRIRAVSPSLDVEHEWQLDNWSHDTDPDWTSYVAGAAMLLRDTGATLGGCDLLIESSVPVGGGLSSSAAIEVSTLLAMARLAGVSLEGVSLADLARRVEHEFAGVPCGIMDQYVSVLAHEGCALLLDCRSRTWQQIPLTLDGHTIVIVNSGVRHKLASGEYAKRQAQCHDAVRYFQAHRPEVQSLRDVAPEEVEQHAAAMDPLAAARARHVTTENVRTPAAAEALRGGDLAEVGRLMLASHASLRDDYEVSCAELDRLVEIATAVDGVVGARMTGGGFGGCIVAIVREDAVPQVESAICEKYDGAGYGPAEIIRSRPGAGASIVQA